MATVSKGSIANGNSSVSNSTAASGTLLGAPPTGSYYKVMAAASQIGSSGTVDFSIGGLLFARLTLGGVGIPVALPYELLVPAGAALTFVASGGGGNQNVSIAYALQQNT